jgi:hypothetical protein
VVAVIELAPCGALTDRQKALIEALLPTVALSTEILVGSIETKKLLANRRGSRRRPLPRRRNVPGSFSGRSTKASAG